MLPDNQTFQVEGRALLSLNGWALKAYILLRNSEEALTCAEIAQALQTERNAVWYALQRELVERRFVQKTDNKYQVFKFPFTPLNEKFTALNDCSKTDKEQERSKEKEKKNSSSSAREKIFSWLTKNEETMRVLCMREKITVEDAQSEDSLREALEPYIEEFWRGLIAEGGDLYQLDPFDTRRHFSNWLRKYRRKEEMDRVERPAFGLKVERKKPDYQIEEQMLMKRRREEKAEELQRKYDEQQAEAEVAGDARAAFFAKRKMLNK